MRKRTAIYISCTVLFGAGIAYFFTMSPYELAERSQNLQDQAATAPAAPPNVSYLATLGRPTPHGNEGQLGSSEVAPMESTTSPFEAVTPDKYEWLSAKLANEPRDFAWASAIESRIYSFASELDLPVLSINAACRTSICRVAMVVNLSDEEPDASEPYFRKLKGLVSPILQQDDLLNSASGTASRFPSAEGVAEMEIYLFHRENGPPPWIPDEVRREIEASRAEGELIDPAATKGFVSGGDDLVESNVSAR